jgi:hypothetical protein
MDIDGTCQGNENKQLHRVTFEAAFHRERGKMTFTEQSETSGIFGAMARWKQIGVLHETASGEGNFSILTKM